MILLRKKVTEVMEMIRHSWFNDARDSGTLVLRVAWIGRTPHHLKWWQFEMCLLHPEAYLSLLGNALISKNIQYCFHYPQSIHLGK